MLEKLLFAAFFTGYILLKVKMKGSGFGEADRRKLDQILSVQGQLVEVISGLKAELKETRRKLNVSTKERNVLKAMLNKYAYKLDDTEQYNRRESFRIHRYPEKKERIVNGNIIDPENINEIVIEMGKEVGLKLTNDDIQRAHRIGKRVTKSGQPRNQPRQIIVKLYSYQKRCDFIVNKKALSKKYSTKDNVVFLTEDLTALRSKLLNYVKNECDGKFKKCHTRNGVIKATYTNDENDKDWKSIRCPDDLFKHGISSIDFGKLGYDMLIQQNATDIELLPEEDEEIDLELSRIRKQLHGS